MRAVFQHWVLTAIFAVLLAPLSFSQNTHLPAVVFTTVEQGKSLLTRHDEFVDRLSPFDRSARLKTDQEVSPEAYLAFVGGSVLSWSNEEQDLIGKAWDQLAPRLSHLRIVLPPTIYFVKTSGREEGGAEYTRGTAIILPASALAIPRRAALEGTIAHELFHVISRNSPDLRERLYKLIGFLPCQELLFPSGLASRKITDPDAPRNDHYIRLREQGQEVLAVPILYSGRQHYDPSKGGEFFQYLTFRFLLVQKSNALPLPQLSYDQKNPTLATLDQLSGFYEQVGRNTKYIINPEEILADNFEFLLLGRSDLPSPKLIQDLSSALQ